MNTSLPLAQLENNNLLRKRKIVTSRQQQFITLNNKRNLNFADNDYLGLTQDPRVKQTFATAANQYGLGSGASAMVAGYSHMHRELEDKAAEFLGREHAILFNSGYHANLGVMTVFAGRHHNIIADKHCHASIIDGITLSRANHHRYHHHDLNHANKLLRDHAAQDRMMITESVFSMTGEITHADKAAEICRANNATLMIDDAHGFGVLGEHGKGVCEHFHLSETDVSVLVTPLGKALGSMGAIVSGKNEVIEMLIQQARTYTYTTAMPPAICAATIKAMEILQTQPWRVQNLQSLIKFFINEAKKRNLALIAEDVTPIKSILTKDNTKTIQLQNKLLEHGFFTAAIRPPTVEKNSARIRISLSTTHTEKDISQLLDCVAEHA